MTLRSIHVRRFATRTRALDDLVEEAWLIEHRNAMFAQDVEDLVDEGLQVLDLASRSWGKLAEAVYAGEEMDHEAVEATFGEALFRIDRVFPRISGIVQVVQRLGYTVAGATELEAATGRAHELRKEFETLWGSDEGNAPPLPKGRFGPQREPDAGPVIAHTDRPRRIEEMAGELDRISRPIVR